LGLDRIYVTIIDYFGNSLDVSRYILILFFAWEHYMNATEVSTAAEKNAVERDIGKRDIAAAAVSLAVGGMGIEDVEGRCGSSERAICAT
jgi:hypothetical protein